LLDAGNGLFAEFGALMASCQATHWATSYLSRGSDGKNRAVFLAA
jgi:hypothetical protein